MSSSATSALSCTVSPTAGVSVGFAKSVAVGAAPPQASTSKEKGVAAPARPVESVTTATTM